MEADGTVDADGGAWEGDAGNVSGGGGDEVGLTGEGGAGYEGRWVAGRQRGLADSVLGPWAGCANGDGEKSITVLITDSCPCGHPNPR